MTPILIPEENRHLFERKEHLSDFDCWAIRKFALDFGYCTKEGEWWWYENELYVGEGTSLWLTENDNIMYEVVSDEVDELYILRFESC